MSPDVHVLQNHVAEWSFLSTKAHDNPSVDVDVDVMVTDPGGETWRVPAFWAGGREWRCRFTPREAGTFSYRSECSDTGDPDLHGTEGKLIVTEHQGELPLMRRGPLRVSAERRHLEHADGTPFFWLGDTWWLGLTTRLPWPEGFQQLTADRAGKGFTVIQVVAGMCPELAAFDERSTNEAGHPWEPEFAAIRPAYFDMADLRIRHLVRAGLVPCILGCWGYYILWTGVEKMKRHWRELVARYSAYPVVWCLAGEGVMPYYLTKTREEDSAEQRRRWTEVAAYVRQIDPVSHPVTIHPTRSARDQVEDDSLLDLDMLQTGHGDRTVIPRTLKEVTGAYERKPVMPMLNSEVCYEGIFGKSDAEVQRFMFWTCVLSGAAGHTYGANGIWQMDNPGDSFGPNVVGGSHSETTWEEASRLPGATQLGAAKKLLARFPWWRMEPHPEWVEPHWTHDDCYQAYCAGIPGELRIVYMPTHPGRAGGPITLKGVDRPYRAFFYDPKNDKEFPLGEVHGDADGNWETPRAPTRQDWVLVLQAADR